MTSVPRPGDRPADPAAAAGSAGWRPGSPLVPPRVTVHRQPVVGRDSAVRGYALHVSVRTPLLGGAGDVDVDGLVHDEYDALDLAALTGGAVAFVRATGAMLAGRHPLPAHTGGLVLVVPRGLADDPAVVRDLAALRGAGVGLCLGDYRADPAQTALLPLVDYVSVDLGRGPEAAAGAARHAHAAGVAVLAERVDSERAARFCADHPVDLMQGPLFPRDTTARSRRLTAGQLQCLELMQLLSADPVDQAAVVRMVTADPELSMRVLRLVNLSAFAVRREVDSVAQAVVLAGPQLLAALAVSALVDARTSPASALWFTLARAGACRLLAHHDNAATVGLLSAVAAQLQIAPDELVHRTGVSADVADAVRHRTGPWGAVLAAVLAHEADDPDGVEASGLSPDAVSTAYLTAVTGAFGAAMSLAGAA
ncbi:EAL and HDOD domain-containing protein [uncultured Cellulomonas sp.]|uniref:EAL and HDOD domain-containing protein n=1 Tax=uncultured Cellulomonas sp. TaxID=189682 RepID=UPI002627B170|nr:HDOD domain-containing protein [uncultured Cellulomonas sp.]